MAAALLGQALASGPCWLPSAAHLRQLRLRNKVPQTGSSSSSSDVCFSRFWRLDFQDQGADRVASWGGLSSWVTASLREKGGSTGVSSYKDMNPVTGAPPWAPPRKPCTSQKPPPDAITLGVGLQHRNRGHTRSLTGVFVSFHAGIPGGSRCRTGAAEGQMGTWGVGRRAERPHLRETASRAALPGGPKGQSSGCCS